MKLIAYGINHHTAPIAIREKLSFNEMQLPMALQDLANQQAVNEAVILSTCNRTEIYTDTTHILNIQQWLANQKSLTPLDLNPYCYLHHDIEAVRHIMRVASGLDSMVLGEPQVLGQMKHAFQIAQNAGTIGNHLKHLFPAVFEASKQIRTDTEIGAHSVSIAYAIVQLSKRIYNRLSDCRVLCIGAGETIELVATHLRGIGVSQITVANRTLEKTQGMVDALNVHAIRIQDIPRFLKDTDIVISATGSQLPILGKGMIESTLKHKKNRPLLLIDLAVPRDIEPEVAKLNHVYLYNIDDLQAIIAQNLKNRSEAAKQAETMIDLQASLFLRKMRVFHARHVIAEYRDRLDKIRMAEFEKALRQLQKGYDPKIVLEQFGHHLMNKIMHHPTVKLREAASESECDLFQHMKTFLEI
ncbi:MAG: glutamyl-tRNA reductase [Gammaproteobacteria bacterium RIFCSPHIGHO2_12_FULL_40_19]|nr:MAG: glutamyl-tRNA reductase [Gammaproteobacteria bacterium RIFCSPHIGHO2_12_FULL_40_19]